MESIRMKRIRIENSIQMKRIRIKNIQVKRKRIKNIPFTATCARKPNIAG